MLEQVVARSPDLATWPTEGQVSNLKPGGRPAVQQTGGLETRSNRQLEIRKLFPARS